MPGGNRGVITEIHEYDVEAPLYEVAYTVINAFDEYEIVIEENFNES